MPCMEYTHRSTSTPNGISYPLPLHGSHTWHRQDNAWIADIPLPEIPREHIVVPSYATLPAHRYQFQWLHQGKPVSSLQPIPARHNQRAQATPEAPVSTHIDCWHTRSAASGSSIRITLLQADTPADDLLAVSVRPLKLKRIDPPKTTAGPVQARDILSQMQAPSAIARRICSPTAVHMALSALTRRSNWPQAIRACYDPASRAFGAWPLAIRWAAACGVLGAVEVFADWDAPLQALAAGSPVVCSVNYAAGELPNAALNQTSGHLLVLMGVGDDGVQVLDPAAQQHADVPRCYPLQAFSRCWLQQRGAAYIFAP